MEESRRLVKVPTEGGPTRLQLLPLLRRADSVHEITHLQQNTIPLAYSGFLFRFITVQMGPGPFTSEQNNWVGPTQQRPRGLGFFFTNSFIFIFIFLLFTKYIPIHLKKHIEKGYSSYGGC